MALPAHLSGMTTREAIIDALYRCVNAYDYTDDTLFESSLTSDLTITMLGQTMHGREEIRKHNYDFVKTLDTTHFLSNIRVQILEGEKEAKVTCNAVAYHYRPGTGSLPDAKRLVSGALYDCLVAWDEGDGFWKIREWEFKLMWREGDGSVMQPSDHPTSTLVPRALYAGFKLAAIITSQCLHTPELNPYQRHLHPCPERRRKMNIFDIDTAGPPDSHRATDSTHRKIELQQPADLTYLIANLSRAAREKLDKHFPPSASQQGVSGEDAMRKRVEDLVSDYITNTFALAKPNLSINGLSSTEMETELARAGTEGGGEEELAPFDSKLAQRLQALSAQIEAQTLQLANLRRTAPGETARKWEEGFVESGKSWEERFAGEERERMEEARGVDVSASQVERQGEVERGWRDGEERLGVLKTGMGSTVARLEKAKMAVEVAEEK
ncbi:hypothetical protein LTR86_006889 [Recurvomyces mirabilis]|nr:hypothetical protein LTR86_006889 [Recurvomyces mirabilis]